MLFGSSLIDIVRSSGTLVKYITGPLLGVILAFILSIIKERFERRREARISLNIILVDLKYNLNVLRNFRDTLKPLDNNRLRFYYLNHITNFPIPDRTITANIAAILEELGDKSLALKLLLSQQSYIGFAHSLTERDKLHKDVVNELEVSLENINLCKLIDIVGSSKLCRLHKLTEDMISSYNHTYKIMRESYIEISEEYKKLGFGDVFTYRPTKPQPISTKIPPPKIRNTEELLKLFKEQQNLIRKKDYIQKW